MFAKLVAAGLGPYVRRITELIRKGPAATVKRRLRYKRRLGTHISGKKKREEMDKAIQPLRSKGGACDTCKDCFTGRKSWL